MIIKSLASGSDPLPLKVFYSYSRKDNADRAAIDDYLARYQWDVRVEPWYDGNIPPGDVWEETIHHSLTTADIILLFVTQRFMQSQYCQDVEVPLALRKQEEGKNRVIPLIFENTQPDWRKMPFARLQVLPVNGKPVAEWPDRKEAIYHISQALINIIVEQGVKQKPRRRRWKLVLEGDRKHFTPEEEYAIITHLRTLTNDPSLRPSEIFGEDITLVMESSDQGLETLLSLYGQSRLPVLTNWRVRAIFELYGAGIHTSSLELSDPQWKAPEQIPTGEDLLYPSAKAHAVVMRSLTVKPKADAFPNLMFGFDDVGASIQGRPITPDVQKRLIDHFLTGLIAKNDDIWVNLAPDERNRMLPEYLSGTNLGHVMIETDYMMKRLSASLLHPDCDTGRQFWKEVFRLAVERHGTSALHYSPFLRVWVVAGEIVIKESAGAALLAEATLNVLCENDYAPASLGIQPVPQSSADLICAEVFKEVVLPVVKKEVREGANWMALREAYSGLILAQLFKARFGEDPHVQAVINTSALEKRERFSIHGENVSLTNLEVPENKEYFDKYMKVFSKGVFYTVRDEYDLTCHKKMARVYLAGAIDFRDVPRRLRFLEGG